jgi:hypothetical protein
LCRFEDPGAAAKVVDASASRSLDWAGLSPGSEPVVLLLSDQAKFASDLLKRRSFGTDERVRSNSEVSFPPPDEDQNGAISVWDSGDLDGDSGTSGEKSATAEETVKSSPRGQGPAGGRYTMQHRLKSQTNPRSPQTTATCLAMGAHIPTSMKFSSSSSKPPRAMTTLDYESPVSNSYFGQAMPLQAYL